MEHNKELVSFTEQEFYINPKIALICIKRYSLFSNRYTRYGRKGKGRKIL